MLEAVRYENTDNVLDTVKPIRLIQRMLQIATTPDEGDIVIDFFAGSNATTHAVLRQNQADAGNRKAIAIQFPERLPAEEAQLGTLADVARQRVGFALAEARRGGHANGGFRAFKLAESSMRRWHGVATKDADAYADELEAFTDTLVHGWEPDNVIWEVALREGYALTSQMDKQAIEGQSIWRVTDPERGQSFHICLDDTLSVEAVRALGLTRENLFICRDRALDDTLAANLALQCRLKVL